MDKLEKVILVGVETQKNEATFASSLEELTALTQTAKGEVVAILTQKRQQYHGKSLIGSGKLEELQALVASHDADLVIFNQELTPRQGEYLKDVLQIPVIDRTQLILDIFALRAQSKEGKLQVELAQLNYLLPRLQGQGIHLSRLGGGIGTRGPGETKLETDRRHIHQKILLIKKELKKVNQQRQEARKKRLNSQIFQVGLIGYTNAGKSSILNLLTEGNTFEENQLFATLDPLTKRWVLKEGFVMTLTDTVGFIQDLPTELIEAFQSTLEESKEMDLLLHVVDSSDENVSQQEKTVLQLLKDLNMDQIPRLTVYNKKDLANPNFTPTLYPNLWFSAKSSTGKEELEQGIRRSLMEILEPYELLLPPEKAQLLHRSKAETLLVTEEFLEEKNSYLLQGFAKKDSFFTTYGKKSETEF